MKPCSGLFRRARRLGNPYRGDHTATSAKCSLQMCAQLARFPGGTRSFAVGGPDCRQRWAFPLQSPSFRDPLGFGACAQQIPARPVACSPEHWPRGPRRHLGQ